MFSVTSLLLSHCVKILIAQRASFCMFHAVHANNLMQTWADLDIWGFLLADYAHGCQLLL